MRQRILHILKTAKDFVSGEDISRELGISRTAIWKHISNLRNDGYNIESVTKKGHRLLYSPEVLYGEEVSFSLNTRMLGKDIVFMESVDSTNNIAKKYADEGCDEGLTVISEEQVGGKGRLSRVWQSPPKVGIWMSLVLRPQVEPVKAPQLALLAAAAVAKAIFDYTGLEAEIKWPNDILISGKKVCGILTEMKAEMEFIHYCVIGIGINVNTTSEQFPVDLADKAASLRMFANQEIKRAGLVRAILQHIESMYLSWQRQGFSPILELWQQKSCTLGRNVIVNTPAGEVISGRAKALDEFGALLIETNQGERKITAGDINLI